MAEITPFKTLALDHRPDVVKFWPHDDHYAVVGTYTLLEDAPTDQESGAQQRVGSLSLLQIGDDEDVTLIQTHPTPFGVYDLHFAAAHSTHHHTNDPGLFAVASSTGSVALYRLVLDSASASISSSDETKKHPTITHLTTAQLFPTDILITSLAWHPSGEALAMTCSDGRVCLARVPALPSSSPTAAATSTSTMPDEENEEHDEEKSLTLTTHDFQAWHCAFAPSPPPSSSSLQTASASAPDSYTLLSGGDDAVLRFSAPSLSSLTSAPLSLSLPLSTSSTDESFQPPWLDRKTHFAGVTFVLPLPFAELKTETGYLLLTGSYDDSIRLLRVPFAGGRREVLAEEGVGGGVFRVKIVSSTFALPASTEGAGGSEDEDGEIVLLVSAMQAGARVLRLQRTGGAWAFEMAGAFEGNEGMLLYSSDVRKRGDGRWTVVSTGFEGRRVWVWGF